MLHVACRMSHVQHACSWHWCVYYPVPPLVSISMETVGVQGGPLTLDCEASGQPAPTVTWLRGPAQVQEDSRLQVDARGRLVFSTVFSTDADTYSCTATNDVGSASANTTLRILGTAMADQTSHFSLYLFLAVIPVITVTTPTVTAHDGGVAVLDCVATGDPQPVITWFFNSAQLPSQDDLRIQQMPSGSLVVSSIQTSDEGAYVCRASNTAGTESATIQLLVNGKWVWSEVGVVFE